MARRAVNLHGCALPHCAPRFSYGGGTPAARSSYWGAPPPASTPPGYRTARTETKEKWASIVKEMQGKKADWISDAEAAKIVDYLAAEHGKK